MRFLYTARFQRAYASLSDRQVEFVKKALRLLVADLRHPSLRVKKMQSTADIRETRASLVLRLTFEIHGEALVLRTVGAHDETLRNP